MASEFTDKMTPPGRGGRSQYRIEGDQVIDQNGVAHDVHEVVLNIPWVKAVKYPPAHEYVVEARCPDELWAIISVFVRDNAASYLAYFRGYQTPNRYLDFDGRRYWLTSSGGVGSRVMMMNRTRFSDCEPPARVDQGATPRHNWIGPPWMPDGSPWPSWYRQGPDGKYVYVAELDPYPVRNRKL